MAVRSGLWKGMASGAEVSGDGLHRYWLTRRWGDGAGVCFIMLNPSRATEAETDATVTRCVVRARDAGFGRMSVVNLFTFMTPRPDDLPGHPGRDDQVNDAHILRHAADAAMRIAAWGGDRRFTRRADDVARMLASHGLALHCLGRTASGAPRHPLYVRKDAVPQPWP
jgi:hypothetical protein